MINIEEPYSTKLLRAVNVMPTDNSNSSRTVTPSIAMPREGASSELSSDSEVEDLPAPAGKPSNNDSNKSKNATTPVSIQLLRENNVLIRTLLAKVEDLGRGQEILSSKIASLELRLSDPAYLRTVDLAELSPASISASPIANRRSTISNTVSVRDRTSALSRPLSYSALNVIKYDRNAQVFSAIILGFCRTIMKDIERSKSKLFAVSLPNHYIKLTSIIEAIVRTQKMPEIRLPTVIQNTVFLDKIKRYSPEDILNVVALTLKQMKASPSTSDIFRVLVLIISSLKSVYLILPYPVNDIIKNIGNLIIRGNEFDIDLSKVGETEFDPYYLKSLDLRSAMKVKVVIDTISGKNIHGAIDATLIEQSNGKSRSSIREDAPIKKGIVFASTSIA